MKIYNLTLVLVTSLLTYLPAQDYNLSLHGGKEIPEEGMRSHISMNEMVNGYYYSVLQFYDMPDVHVREQLADAGIELLEYIPNYSWISRIKGGADMSDIPIRGSSFKANRQNISITSNRGLSSMFIGIRKS